MRQRFCEKGRDIMALYKPKWETSDRKQFDKALQAAKRVTDQRTLKEIALHAHFSEIRQDALDRITDKDILIELGTTFDPFLCRAVVSRVDDEEMLKEIALHGSCDTWLPRAVEKIKNTGMLVDIACSNAVESVVSQAIKQMEDPDVLETAFFETCNETVRREIWKKIPLETARKIADDWYIPEKEICEKIGAHCNAPGPKSRFIETDQETGSREHELICCALCGKPLWSRRRAAAEWGVWEGGYIDLRQWKNWRLKDGIWHADGRNNSAVCVMTEDCEGCRSIADQADHSA